MTSCLGSPVPSTRPYDAKQVPSSGICLTRKLLDPDSNLAPDKRLCQVSLVGLGAQERTSQSRRGSTMIHLFPPTVFLFPPQKYFLLRSPLFPNLSNYCSGSTLGAYPKRSCAFDEVP